MQTLSEIRSLLESRGLRPRKSFGQNFLHDHNQLAKLLSAADIQRGELVLEVGPGTGTLTETLLDAGARVIACELDEGLAALLGDRLGDRITLVHGDCLAHGRSLNPQLITALAGEPFKLVANLPYQAASPLMATLLIEHAAQCIGQWITIQKEVADRLTAGPGSKQYGPLGIIVQSMATVRRVGIVPPSCFWPQPKVTSAMVAIRSDESQTRFCDDHAAESRRAFARFVTELFMKRRKQLRSSFDQTVLNQLGIEAAARPDQLTIDQLVSLRQATAGHTPAAESGASDSAS